MKIVLLTESGKHIGNGHLTRCLSLYQALQEYKIKPLIIINGDDTTKDIVKNVNAKIFNWIINRNKLFKIIKDTDAVIIDSYLADIALYKNIGNYCKILLSIDDFKRLSYPTGIVLNGTIFAEKLGYNKKRNIKYLLGHLYIPLRKDFWRQSKHKISKTIKNILIIFGGQGIGSIVPSILNIVNINFPDSKKHVILGSSDTQIGYDKNITYYKNLTSKHIRLLMLKSDLAFSAGGQTLYELANCGVPTIAISVAKNQMNNIKGFLKAGFIEYAGRYNQPNILENIQRSIEKIVIYDIRLSKSKIGQTLIDGKGALRVVKELIDELKKKF